MVHLTVLVTRARNNVTLWVPATLIAVMILACGRTSARVEVTSPEQNVAELDLTKPVPPEEQGFHGIPGGEGGSEAIPPYQLPLEIRLLGSSPSASDQYTIQVTVKNIGTQDFELPILKNLTSVEKSGNKSRRLFFFLVEALPGGQSEPVGVGDAVVSGSGDLPGSLRTLSPGRSVNVLLPASTELLKRALRGSRDQVEVRVFCNEWQLADSRYSTRATSKKVMSTNSVSFVMHDNKPVPQQH